VDFVHDQLATGKKLRVLTVVDTFSRYVPGPRVTVSSAILRWKPGAVLWWIEILRPG
jgi:transposase InsO family protein